MFDRTCGSTLWFMVIRNALADSRKPEKRKTFVNFLFSARDEDSIFFFFLPVRFNLGAGDWESLYSVRISVMGNATQGF